MTIFQSPADEKKLQIHHARVMLAEARNRRDYNSMHANLLTYAANARKRAAAMLPADLFTVTSQERSLGAK